MGEEMLAYIKKNTSDWQLAYTDEEEEPIYLPGRIPNLLVNGTSGIAVAMACSFAPHNLNEVMDAAKYLLDNPTCEIKDLLTFIKGPDFPTGGMIINKDELLNTYITSKGRARIRGEYTIESNKGQDSIVFTSIPYKVSKTQLILDIDKLCEDGTLEGITAIRDESNIQGVRFVIELAKGVSAEPIISKLFKNTRLEDTYSINQVALVNKKPELLNLKRLLEIYNEHPKDVLIRKTNFEAEKIRARIHILDGLLIALEDIDNVIALIKKSESAAAAKVNLINQYNLSEVQAKAILDMKLAKLAKLEKVEIQEEKNNLVKELDHLNNILANPIPEMKNIYTEIEKNYGDERRSTITQVAITKEEKEIEFVEPEKCVVVMTEGGSIKRIPTSSFRTQKKNGKGIKSQDDITSCVLRTNTIDNLMIFSDKGIMYRLLVDNIPVGTNTSIGQSIKSLVNMAVDENPATMYSIYRDTNAKYVLFTTKNGLVKKTTLDEYIKTKKKTGIAAIALRENDGLASVSLIDNEPILLLTKNGYIIRFNSSEITPTSRSTYGIKGITLSEGDEVVMALPIRHDTDNLAVFTTGGMGKKVPLTEITIQKRGGKGLYIYKPTASTGNVISASLIDDNDNLLISGNSASICISAKDIPVLGRTSIGNQMIKSGSIKSVTKV